MHATELLVDRFRAAVVRDREHPEHPPVRSTKGVKRMTSRFSWVVVMLAFAPAVALAQSMSVTPNAGQSQSQMQKDMAECQAIAQQSGTAQAASPQRGGRVRGAAAGAAAGAVGAEVRGQQHAGYDRLSDDAKQQYRQNNAGSA